MAVFLQPIRTGTETTHGSVRLTMKMDGFGKQPFETIPETQGVENRVEKIRDRAVVAVFGVGVVKRVMFGRLQDADVLQK